MFKLKYILPAAVLAFATTSCSDFLEEQVPQGTLSQEQALQVENTEAMVIAAYAGLTTIEDINASFSLWNYDVRSDDAYKGGANEGDGNVFHNIETGLGIQSDDWSINGPEGIWARLYNFISRTNTALALLNSTDETSFPQKKTRIAEMKFLRAYGHFQLKRLFGNIPFVLNENLRADEYYKISNVQYSNDEGWRLLAEQLENAIENLPEKQVEKGRPTQAACAALLAKVYLYKAYRKDETRKNVFSGVVDEGDLRQVLKYTNPQLYGYSNYDLEPDFHNNFRPEEEYENGIESIWAVQYSFNDGSVNGNRNFGCALMAPNVESATTGGHDFYKPSQNLVNAFRTDHKGLPMDNFDSSDYDVTSDNVDPRLYLTVGMVGFPYMFNPKYIQQQDWARNGAGLYGYNICLKYNVDLDYVGKDTYIKKCGWCWATSMNRQVFRLADVMLMRAEAQAQLNNLSEVKTIINSIRDRASKSINNIIDYPKKYGVKFKVGPYDGFGSKEEALKAVKFERRLELAMEAERFFDLVRWGDAKKVLDKFYATDPTGLYRQSNFTENKLEYMPIPFNEIQSSDNLYKQNPGY